MKVFVTGTDTDIGKTVVAAWLCLHSGADYWKPIQTGHAPQSSTQDDSATVVRLSGAYAHAPRHLLRAPLSPHHAALHEGLRISLDDFVLSRTSRPLVMEGAGGVLAPINERETMLDLMARLGAPVIVAARSGLGTINHTCLTLAALRSRNLPVLGVVLSGPLNPENRAAVEHFGNAPVLAEIPTLSPVTQAALQGLAPGPAVLDWVRWRS